MFYAWTLHHDEFPRSYIDVNRAVDDIDPAILDELPQEPINPTSRSTAGYGLIRRLVRPGLPVYDRALSVTDLNQRVQRYYSSYHNILDANIEKLHYDFGQVFYLNMHSMPDSSAHSEDGHPVDFVLGDRHGTTARRDFVRSIRDLLERQGYSVSLNDPYQGVELITRYSNPAAGYHALQIEINKALYWNEKTQELLPEMAELQKNMRELFDFCAWFCGILLLGK